MVGLLIFLILVSPSLHAKDYGVHGHTFEILEPDLLKQILRKLSVLEESGTLEAHNRHLKKRVRASLHRPPSVSGIKHATTSRTFIYDPTITVPYDLKDHEGRVFHKAGTKINPLTIRPMKTSLIFLDGNNEEQVVWALKNFPDLKTKIILTSGSPFDLMDIYDRPFYFDQGGALTQKLGIKQVPAVVFQEGMQLKIEEKAL